MLTEQNMQTFLIGEASEADHGALPSCSRDVFHGELVFHRLGPTDTAPNTNSKSVAPSMKCEIKLFIMDYY